MTFAQPIAPPISYRPAVFEARRAHSPAMVLEQTAYACLWLFVFVTPWSESAFELGGIEFNRWFGMAAFLFAVLRACLVTRRRRWCDLHYWMLAFAGWSMVSVLWTVDLNSTLERLATYAQLMILAWVVWVLCPEESRIVGLLQSYVMGTCVCSIGTIANVLAGRSMSQLDGMDGAGSDRYTIQGLNPNDLGLMLALSIPMTLYLLAKRKDGKVGAVACWVQFALAMTAILLSGSRGSLLAASAALLMLPLVLARIERWQIALMAIALIGCAAAAASIVPDDTLQRFRNLGNEISEGTMTHRTQIWAASGAVIQEHPLIGVGSAAHPIAVEGILGRPLVAHNTFLSPLVELGVVGELLLLGLLAGAYYHAFKMPRLERSLWVLTLTAWCIGACGGTIEYRKVTWLVLSLLAAHAWATRGMALRGRRTRVSSICVASPVF